MIWIFVKKQRRTGMAARFFRSATLALLFVMALCLTAGIAPCVEFILENSITYGRAGDTDLPGADPRCEGGHPLGSCQCREIPRCSKPDWSDSFTAA
jgi:hypothetical protein